MTQSIKTVGILLLMFAVQVTYGQKSEEKLVRKSFENYKNTILNDNGEEAVKYVDSRTINYYNEILKLVRTADSTTIETLSILDKLMVFSVRHRTSKEDIASFEGRSLFIYAIKSGMVGKNSVSNNSIGDVETDEDFAKGQLVVKDQKTPFYFHFYKEKGQWKIDLTSLFPITTMTFQKMADESELNQNEYLFSLLEMITGKKPDQEIWKPVL